MTTIARPVAAGTASALRRLYLVRFVFAVVWAVAVFAVGSHLGPVAVTLLVLYPLFDVAAAVADLRSTRAPWLYVNMAVSLLAALGVGLAGASGVPAVLRVWGAWAIVAGLVQLVVGVVRRRLGGQWAMIASGGISVLAGASFVLQAGQGGGSLTRVAGYAVLGGVFFLVSALRLGRSARATA